MNLQGFYTNKGRSLASKIAGGIAPLTVTRVVAGSGHTADIPSATSLPDIEQTLTVGTAVVEGATATLPVTLAEAQAEDDYALTELGVYADDGDEGEILFQVYQLSAPQDITGGGEGTLRFYLRQSIGAQGVTVTCSGAGLLTEDDIAPIRARVLSPDVPSRSVSVALEDLQDYLDSLPRLLCEHLTVNVSGSFSGSVDISGFYGSGSLTVDGGGSAALTGNMRLTYCGLQVNIQNMSFTADGGTTDVFRATAMAGNIAVIGCSVNGAGVTSRAGVAADDARVYLIDTPVRRCYIAVFAVGLSHIAIKNDAAQSYSGNTYGCYAYNGGVIAQGANVPLLLGGSSNIKGGGLIVKYDGTLA